MAVIPAGNGTDPWTLARDWIRNQQTQQLSNNRSEDLARQQNFQREQFDRRPEDAYNTARAVGKANLENSQDAIAAGLDPNDARSGVSRRFGGGGSGPVDMRSAAAFAKGLGDGGITGSLAQSVLMGNAQSESGFNTRASGDKDANGNPTAFGIMQWRLDRQQKLREFAAEMGKPVDDPYVQGRYTAWELTQNPSYKAQGQALQAATTIEDAQLAANSYLKMAGWQSGTGARDYAGRVANSYNWAKDVSKLQAAELKAKAKEPQTPHILTDEAGKRYQVAYPNPRYLLGLEAMPNTSNLAKRYKPDPTLPLSKNFETGYRYYIDDPDTPPATTPTATPQPTSPVAPVVPKPNAPLNIVSPAAAATVLPSPEEETANAIVGQPQPGEEEEE